MYAIVVATNIGIFVLLALSLNIIAGYAGQSSIGHAAFFGIGAYTSAVLTSTLGVNFWLSLPIAFVVTGLIGALLGLASMRVKEDFLAITTIGINFVVVAIFQYAPIFGASLGMSVSKPSLFGVKMDNLMFLILVGALIAAMVIFMRIIEKSWFGLALASIRNDEAAASSLGVNIVKFKVLAFAVGTAVAGLAGGVYAHYMTFIYSSDFAFLVSISILSMVVIGGIGTIRGPIVGAIILGIAPELFRFISDYRMIVYGGLLVLMMLFQPQGIVGNGSFLVNKFEALFGKGRKKSVVS
ncbi:branched-chain amino acid ABC transporter permease [Acidaminobacter sp.]|uniref:branched-chain amino acid ABC transporter permease n=1 Tax=Acidaminobacter sp. TaxID=1872102 RepID=UPI001381E186|nr:branched-chain amino acid ABC transporter permease [Acidaminobacter sp.]MDK9711586.1 branched-chain amino acid ABC transporter permease [Acidaminobacter sp.]MZQ97245.1 branched-chain amino acid ABC transporter permease [Acidaminobacter sp.]